MQRKRTGTPDQTLREKAQLNHATESFLCQNTNIVASAPSYAMLLSLENGQLARAAFFGVSRFAPGHTPIASVFPIADPCALISPCSLSSRVILTRLTPSLTTKTSYEIATLFYLNCVPHPLTLPCLLAILFVIGSCKSGCRWQRLQDSTCTPWRGLQVVASPLSCVA